MSIIVVTPPPLDSIALALCAAKLSVSRLAVLFALTFRFSFANLAPDSDVLPDLIICEKDRVAIVAIQVENDKFVT